MKHLFRAKSTAGFSLIEVMVAGAIVAIIGLAVGTVLTNTAKSQRGLQAKDMQREVIAEIRTMLNSKQACANTFPAASTLPAGANVVNGFTVANIRDGAVAPGVIRFSTNVASPVNKDRSGLLQFFIFSVSDYVPDPTAPNQGKAILNIRLKKTGTGVGAVELLERINLQVKKTTPALGNRITECFTYGSQSDGLWQVSPFNSSNIYYSAGKVGIGTNDPIETLHVEGPIRAGTGAIGGYRFPPDPGGGAGDSAKITHEVIAGEQTALKIYVGSDPVASGNGDEIQIGAQGGIKFFTDTVASAYSQRMIIDSAGNVGIGATAPRTRVDVNGEIATASRLTMTTDLTSTSPTWSMDNFADRFRIFRQPNISTAGSEFATVTNAGNLGIGTATPLEKLHVVGNIFATGVMEATAYNWTSDLKLKNIISKSSGLEAISQLNGYKFSWKKDGKKDYGIIAQEVEKVFPELVTNTQDYKSVNYMGLVAPLIESVKELQQQQQLLTKKMKKLETDLAAKRKKKR